MNGHRITAIGFHPNGVTVVIGCWCGTMLVSEGVESVISGWVEHLTEDQASETGGSDGNV